jgi:hypothetical protein
MAFRTRLRAGNHAGARDLVAYKNLLSGNLICGAEKNQQPIRAGLDFYTLIILVLPRIPLRSISQAPIDAMPRRLQQQVRENKSHDST